MRNQKGFTGVELLVVVFLVTFFVCWVWNAVKLASCDFKADYRCEALHGVGLVIPPLSVATVWFGGDDR